MYKGEMKRRKKKDKAANSHPALPPTGGKKRISKWQLQKKKIPMALDSDSFKNYVLSHIHTETTNSDKLVLEFVYWRKMAIHAQKGETHHTLDILNCEYRLMNQSEVSTEHAKRPGSSPQDCFGMNSFLMSENCIQMAIKFPRRQVLQ